MPTPGFFPPDVKELILDAWRPDWTRPGHPKYKEQEAKDAEAPKHAEEIATMLRDWEKPQVDQALAALEDAGYQIVKVRLPLTGYKTMRDLEDETGTPNPTELL